MNHPIRNFADKPLRNSEDFRQMCDGARRACVELSDALYFMAKVSQAQLMKYEKKLREQEKARAKREGRHWTPRPLMYWRARAVAAVITRAAAWCRSAARVCDKAFRTYLKHYAADVVISGDRAFNTTTTQRRSA